MKNSIIKSRPVLFQDFFNLLITWSNEVIDYIQTTSICVTPKTTNKPKSIYRRIFTIISKTFDRIKDIFRIHLTACRV
jgi:hypothetical protein